MDGAPPPSQGPPMRGGFRGRGGPPMRGYDRGRGRGMGRGGPMMGVRGGMGGPPMMRGRGMMRGGPPRGMGFSRGCLPRGMPMRGGRPPVHVQQQNLTSPPTQPPPPAENSTDTANGSSSNASTATTTTTVQTTSTSSSVPSSRGVPRGRGGLGSRRGGYIPSTNGSMGHDSSKPPPMGKSYRGGPPRGRGGFGQGMARPPPPHSANTQVTPVPTLKRGAPSGPPGPKRGRYDQAPVNRQLIPKHHQVQTVHPSSHTGYANVPIQRYSKVFPYTSFENFSESPSFSHHTGYQSHDQMPVDQYSQQAYAAPPPQNAYNGYAQQSYAATTGYAQGSEYDQSQYQSYNTSAYNQQDTRYQGYAQDYSQTYGAPAVDYTAPPPDYSQQTQAYDDRSYAGYDTQAYSQGYANAAGYY